MSQREVINPFSIGGVQVQTIVRLLIIEEGSMTGWKGEINRATRNSLGHKTKVLELPRIPN